MNDRFRFSYRLFWLIAPLFALSLGCSELLTEAPEALSTLEEPFEGLNQHELAAFARGDEGFEQEFTAATGLGPVFNNTACGSCHPGDGRAHPRDTFTLFGKVEGNTVDVLHELGGPQLQDRSIPGVPPEQLPAEANAVSERAAPPVFGVGLIEFIPEQDILANADPDDANGDGISGRPHWVRAAGYVPPDVVGSGSGDRLGRFGQKANTSNLLEQIARAYHQDIGITTEFLPQENFPSFTAPTADQVPDPELSSSTVQDVLFYIRFLSPPKRGAITPQVQAGEVKFKEIGCASCHVQKFRTGPSPFGALAFKDAELYSDLLLHDMGDELADNFIDGNASGREWKTRPLWGLGRTADALGGVAYYLHDGRTSDLQEAIVLHGGEAQGSRDRFANLSESQKQELLAFLNSL